MSAAAVVFEDELDLRRIEKELLTMLGDDLSDVCPTCGQDVEDDS